MELNVIVDDPPAADATVSDEPTLPKLSDATQHKLKDLSNL